MSFFDHFVEAPGTPLGNWLLIATKRQEFGFLRRYIKQEAARILEIGAGNGETAELFLKAGFRSYTAIEPNRVMRERLSRLGLKVRDYVVPDIFEENASYDVVLLEDAFEHLDTCQVAERVVAEAYRVLRPGGLLCISSPDYLHWGSDFFNCDYSHNNVTSVRRTLQILHNNGFSTVGFRYYSGFLYGPVATLMSWCVRCVFWSARGNATDSKLYKLKLTLLRRFTFIGRKVA